MGTPTAPSYANIFLYSIEINLFTKYQPIYYMRYIDDIFAIFESETTARSFFDEYNLHTPSIKLDLVSLRRDGVILDLEVKLTNDNNNDDIITHKLYQKALNIYQYITPTSEHQRHVLQNFIAGELIRYRVCCTEDNDYDTIVIAFLKRLSARGYPSSILHDPLTLTPSRKTLLSTIKNQLVNKQNYKNLLSSNHTKKPMIILNIPRLLNIDKWSEIFKLPEYLTNLRQFKKAYHNTTNLIIGRRNPPSIGSHLVRSTYKHTYPVNNLKRPLASPDPTTHNKK
jgi:hypothetical protein